MRFVADLLYVLAGLAYLPVALYTALVVGKNRRGWGQRFGRVPKFDPSRPRIWMHAVSLGEINATPLLVEALRRALPEVDFVFSTTTDTGFARAVQLFGAERVFRFPLDFSPVVARTLRRIRPSMIVLVELEVWYNLVRMATARGVPVVVVNGRLTERSARRFALLGRFGRRMFADLAWVGAQDEDIARRFRAIGVPEERVSVTSSMKWDSAVVTDRVDGDAALARALGLDDGRPLWVCGSTGPGEDAMVLDAYRNLAKRRGEAAREAVDVEAKSGAASALRLAIVPRKPERFDEVARIIERSGFVCIRRTTHPDDTPVEKLPDAAVILGDTMGELRKFYALADVVFVGRSLVPMGGSDPMEAAALGKPIVVGRHTDNFREPIEALLEADAVRIAEEPSDLADIVLAMLLDNSLADGLRARAKQVVLDHQGATERTAERLVRLFHEATARASRLYRRSDGKSVESKTRVDSEGKTCGKPAGR